METLLQNVWLQAGFAGLCLLLLAFALYIIYKGTTGTHKTLADENKNQEKTLDLAANLSRYTERLTVAVETMSANTALIAASNDQKIAMLKNISEIAHINMESLSRVYSRVETAESSIKTDIEGMASDVKSILVIAEQLIAAGMELKTAVTPLIKED